MSSVDTIRSVLNESTWETVSRDLLAKMLAEFAYEEIIDPSVVQSWDDQVLYELEYGSVTYQFEATKRVFDSYRVHENTIKRRSPADDGWVPISDPIQFLTDAREHLGISHVTASHLVREYYNTLLADAHIETRRNRDPWESIVDMSSIEIEGELEGHPWFTMNKGRVGFAYDDYLAYAPERKEPQRLVWLAVKRENAIFTTVDGLDYDTLVRDELRGRRAKFHDNLRTSGYNPSSYYLLPVHEWQWNNTISQLFAADIATNDIVPLGMGPNRYVPQQSVRTLTKIDDPEKRRVKVPIQILNTSVYRGLPKNVTVTVPRVSEVLKDVCDGDRFLRDECSLVLPGEVASVYYEHPTFSQIPEAPYQYQELLGAIWRESVEELVESDERPLALAALAHEDRDGSPVVCNLASSAQVSLEQWLEELFEVVLNPLLHFLYRYGIAFSPHGANVFVVMENGRPVRLAIKDFFDTSVVDKKHAPECSHVPDRLYQLNAVVDQKSPMALSQSILGTLFVCVFRYISDLLEHHKGYSEMKFWRQVRGHVEQYQKRFPAFEASFDQFDLFVPTFPKVCLNRNRLLEYEYADDHETPQVSAHGRVTNALHEVGE